MEKSDVKRDGTITDNKVVTDNTGCEFKNFEPIHSLRVSYIGKLLEGHKLHNISGHRFSGQRFENATVPIQKLHGLKICLTHAHDDDGHGQFGAVHDGLSGLVKISDLSISDDQQHKVLLIERKKKTHIADGLKMPWQTTDQRHMNTHQTTSCG